MSGSRHHLASSAVTFSRRLVRPRKGLPHGLTNPAAVERDTQVLQPVLVTRAVPDAVPFDGLPLPPPHPPPPRVELGKWMREQVQQWFGLGDDFPVERLYTRRAGAKTISYVAPATKRYLLDDPAGARLQVCCRRGLGVESHATGRARATVTEGPLSLCTTRVVVSKMEGSPTRLSWTQKMRLVTMARLAPRGSKGAINDSAFFRLRPHVTGPGGSHVDASCSRVSPHSSASTTQSVRDAPDSAYTS